MTSAILAALLSTIFASGKDLISKNLSTLVHGNISAFASFLYAIPWYFLFLGTCFAAGLPIFDYAPGFLFFVTLRAMTDTCAEFFKMHAISQGDISFIANFLSLAPLFLLFTAPLITGEYISGIGFFGVILISTGTILFVYHPLERAKGIPWKGIILGTLSSFFFSLNSCFDRLSVQQANPILSGFAMTFLSMIFLLPSLYFVKNPLGHFKSGNKQFHLRGLLEALFMCTKLYAMQFMEPQYVVGIGKIGLVLSIIGGSVFYKETGTGRRLIISTLIVAGSAMIVMSKV
ncbi:MAG TPA: EamA family transporter [Oligoflexia bacterium]|nr:EamA family transporter [Oligoflexia bacterium]HMP47057.1 EamA family transporter [Oligoflexia bacterium]